jgi:curli biogenesis system outer membrane secretion channel CsgG
MSLVRWFLAFSVLLCSAATAGTHAGLKRRVAVMDMAMTATTLSQSSPGSLSITTTIQIPPPADFALGLTEILTTELAKTGRVIVLERKALQDITAEQDLVTAGRVNLETGAKAGAIIGAQALIRCGVTEYSYTQTGTSANIKVLQGLSLGAAVVQAQVGLDCRIYDARTSEVLTSTVSRGAATAKGADVRYSNEQVEGGAAGFMTTPLGRPPARPLMRRCSSFWQSWANSPGRHESSAPTETRST